MSVEKTKAAPEPISKERLRLWLKLLKSSSMIEDEIRRRLRREFASTLPRFDVMSALSRNSEGLKMSQISELLRVSNGNITGIVDKLGEEGLALRVAVPGDRRASLVRLTPKGLEEFACQAEAHETWINDMLGDLDARDVDGMNTRLDRLVEALGVEIPPLRVFVSSNLPLGSGLSSSAALEVATLRALRQLLGPVARHRRRLTGGRGTQRRDTHHVSKH